MSKRKSEICPPAPSGTKRQCSTVTVQSSLHDFFQRKGTQSGSCSSVPSSKRIQSPESYGIRIYNSQEIETAKGLEKDYRTFWNAKAVELCGDKSAQSRLGSKVAIQGAINTSWTLYKTDLLKLKVEELCRSASDVYPDDKEREPMLSSIYRNVDRMTAATATMNTLYAELETGCPEPSHLKETQDVVAKELTELRKSQEALIKALGRMEMKLGLAKQKQQDVMITTDPPEQLSSKELESIIHQITTEEHSPVFESLKDAA